MPLQDARDRLHARLEAAVRGRSHGVDGRGWGRRSGPARGSSRLSAPLSEETETGDSSEEPATDGGLADDQAREEYLDRLFQEFDEDLEDEVAEGGREVRANVWKVPTVRLHARLLIPRRLRTRIRLADAMPTLVLLAIGVVLIAGGFVGTLLVQAADVLLILILDVGIVAVMVVAVSVLLLPDRPALH